MDFIELGINGKITPKHTVAELHQRIRTCGAQFANVCHREVRPYRCIDSLRSQPASVERTLLAA
jgi:hypothetical protein